jgi:hypothetical protein
MSLAVAPEPKCCDASMWRGEDKLANIHADESDAIQMVKCNKAMT